jgi:RNA polymerase sigma-70 factor (ECF subfamily)
MSATSQAGAMTTEALFRQHAPFVARFLARLGVPAEQAQDALQEVFLVVHRNGGYRPGLAKPTSYLASIAIHAANKHRRRERVDRARHSEAAPEQVASGSADPARTLQSQQELGRLQLALDRLPDALRTTLVLVDIEGETCLSVAAALGWPVGTVYWRLHEARKKLQLALRSVDGARAQQRAVASQPVPPERRRALRVPNLGMLMLFGADASFQRSEAGQLLRLAREQPPGLGAPEALLARHLALVQAGAHLPAWASSCVPHSVSWLGLLGLGRAASIAAVTAAGLASVLLVSALKPPPSAAARVMPRLAAARLGAAPLVAVAPLQPSVLAPAAPSQPSALPVPRPSPGVLAVSRPRAADAQREIGARALSTNAARAVAVAPIVPREPSAERPPVNPVTNATYAEERDLHAMPASAAVSGKLSRAPAPDALQEMQQIASAERLLTRAPAAALTIVREVQARFPRGYLSEERAYVEVMALLGLGRTAEARSKAEAFLRTYPDGPYSRRVRGAAAGTER